MVSPSRIAHVITSLEGGGSENFLVQLIHHSPAEWTHRVYFLKKDGITGDRLRSMGITPERVSLYSLYTALLLDKPAVIHTLLYRAHQVGRLVGRMAGVPRIVSSQRSIDAWTRPWHRALDRVTLRSCDLVVANSSAAEALIRERRGKDSKPELMRIKNGIDPTRFFSQDKIAARLKLGLPENALLGGSLMRLHKEKGADRIPAFAEALLSAQPSLHLIVGGVGPLESDLRRATAHAPWSPRLHWLGWVENTPAFLASLDFFWSLSREESFPQSLLEASAMGIPWAAPDVGGIRELAEGDSARFRLHPPASDSIADACSTLIKDMDLLAPAARADAAQVAEKFSIKNEILAFYARLS